MNMSEKQATAWCRTHPELLAQAVNENGGLVLGEIRAENLQEQTLDLESIKKLEALGIRETLVYQDIKLHHIVFVYAADLYRSSSAVSEQNIYGITQIVYAWMQKEKEHGQVFSGVLLPVLARCDLHSGSLFLEDPKALYQV